MRVSFLSMAMALAALASAQVTKSSASTSVAAAVAPAAASSSSAAAAQVTVTATPSTTSPPSPPTTSSTTSSPPAPPTTSSTTSSTTLSTSTVPATTSSPAAAPSTTDAPLPSPTQSLQPECMSACPTGSLFGDQDSTEACIATCITGDGSDAANQAYLACQSACVAIANSTILTNATSAKSGAMAGATGINNDAGTLRVGELSVFMMLGGLGWMLSFL